MIDRSNRQRVDTTGFSLGHIMAVCHKGPRYLLAGVPALGLKAGDRVYTQAEIDAEKGSPLAKEASKSPQDALNVAYMIGDYCAEFAYRRGKPHACHDRIDALISVLEAQVRASEATTPGTVAHHASRGRCHTRCPFCLTDCSPSKVADDRCVCPGCDTVHRLIDLRDGVQDDSHRALLAMLLESRKHNEMMLALMYKPQK